MNKDSYRTQLTKFSDKQTLENLHDRLDFEVTPEEVRTGHFVDDSDNNSQLLQENVEVTQRLWMRMSLVYNI